MKEKKINTEMGEKIISLRNQGVTWTEITKEFDASLTTLKRAYNKYKKEVTFPQYQNAKIRKMVPNPRLVQITLNGKTEIAIIKPGGNRFPGQNVTVEAIDKGRYRVV